MISALLYPVMMGIYPDNYGKPSISFDRDEMVRAPLNIFRFHDK